MYGKSSIFVLAVLLLTLYMLDVYAVCKMGRKKNRKTGEGEIVRERKERVETRYL